MRQGWEKKEKKRRPCSGRTSRSLWAAGREEQRLRRVRVSSLRAISSEWGKVHTQPRRGLAAIKKMYIYRPAQPMRKNYRPAPSKKNKIITVPSRRGEKMYTVPSGRGKNIYRPVPPRKTINTVPSRRRKKQLPSRPVVKFVPLHVTVPSRREIVHPPSRPVTPIFFSSFYRPVVICFPAKQEKYVTSRPATILSHCDKPWLFPLFRLPEC